MIEEMIAQFTGRRQTSHKSSGTTPSQSNDLNGEEKQEILEEVVNRLKSIEQIVSKPQPDSTKLQAKYDKAKTEATDLRAQLDQAQNEARDLRGKTEVLGDEIRQLYASLEEVEFLKKENIALNDYVRKLESTGRERIGKLQKTNDTLKEEIDRLRATVVGTEFQAWDLNALLSQYSSVRERWVSQFLFPGDAKDGALLAITVQSVFRWTQSFTNGNVKAIISAMYDVNQSETNIQFIKGTLQSNYASFEVDLRNRILEAAKADKCYCQLKESYANISAEVSGDPKEAAHTNFDKLFNDVIKICGMLVLCEPRLDVLTECDMGNPAAFDIRITTAERLTVCFPGLILKEGGEYRWKQRVCVATPLK